MMKRLMIAAAMLLGFALHAEEGPLQLKGKLGIGLDSMPGLTLQQASILGALVKTPDTLVVRYWLSEKFSLEAQLAASYSSQPAATTGTASTRTFGVGLAAKWNFKRPTETSLAQLVLGIDHASISQGPDSNGATQTIATTSLYVGPGFEYFMPFLRSASVEGSLRLRVSSTESKSDKGSQAAQSSSAIDLSGNGFTPLNLSIHYYF